MKKILFMAAMVLMSACCMAQKANVRKAQNLMSAETPDFNGAREAIKAALNDPETMNDANTWFVAGEIGHKQNEYIRSRAYLGEKYDQRQKGEAIVESYNYWLTCDSLCMLPMLDKNGQPKYDKKGNPVFDTKTRAKMAAAMVDYFNQQDFCMYAQYLSDQNENEAVAEAFKIHCDIPELPMMQDPKVQSKLKMDTLYWEFMNYSAYFFYRADRLDDAYKMFQRLEKSPKFAVMANEYFYDIKKRQGDLVGARAILDEAINKFPKEPWFIQNMINDMVQTNDTASALNYVNRAIATDPTQAQYYHVKATLLSTTRRFDESFPIFEEAIRLDPNNADYELSYAYAYSDKASVMLEGTDNLSQKAYMARKAESDAVRKLALPHFRRAFELKHERSYGIALRACYYQLQMMDEYQKVNEELSNL